MTGANSDRNVLFPSEREREAFENALTEALLAAKARIADGPVMPGIDRRAFREELAGFDFAEGRPLDELLSWTIARMERGIVQMTNPRYFGLFNPAPTYPAEAADRIAAAFNPQLASSASSPVPVEIEAHTIRAVGRRIGLPGNATGHFTTGGSEANFTALLCALTKAEPDFATGGARAFSGPPVFYVSKECHLAWLKIAHMAGIGRTGARFVRTDGMGRMDASALAAAIAADRAGGCHPVMIAATAGTTNAGMIDPLAECADIAAASGMWLHVDAAWGGALIASDKLRQALAGIERADSVTIDAHKWFATTMCSGMFLTPHAAALSSAFAVSADFMPSHVEGVDPYVTTLQWSRRFSGLRLFLSLASAGWPGYGRHVERAVELAALMSGMLRSLGWSIANIPDLAVVCAEPPAGSAAPASIVNTLRARGRVWASAARFENREVVRACITHGATRATDVEELVAALDRARRA